MDLHALSLGRSMMLTRGGIAFVVGVIATNQSGISATSLAVIWGVWALLDGARHDPPGLPAVGHVQPRGGPARHARHGRRRGGCRPAGRGGARPVGRPVTWLLAGWFAIRAVFEVLGAAAARSSSRARPPGCGGARGHRARGGVRHPHERERRRPRPVRGRPGPGLEPGLPDPRAGDGPGARVDTPRDPVCWPVSKVSSAVAHRPVVVGPLRPEPDAGRDHADAGEDETEGGDDRADDGEDARRRALRPGTPRAIVMTPTTMRERRRGAGLRCGGWSGRRCTRAAQGFIRRVDRRCPDIGASECAGPATKTSGGSARRASASRSPLPPHWSATISAAMLIAVSSGVRAPRSRPIGLDSRSISSSVRPASLEPGQPVVVGTPRAHRADVRDARAGAARPRAAARRTSGRG